MSASTGLVENIEEKVLTKYVRFLIGSFRVGDAEDGEVLTRGLTALLGSYPEWVVRGVCDPRGGLPATSKFFPTLYEVRSACEARMRPLIDAEGRRRQEVENAREEPPTPAENERRKAFIADWRLKQAAREVDAGGPSKLDDMDARHCRGEMRGHVVAALDAKLSRLSSEYASTPCAPLSKYAGEGRVKVGGMG